MVGVLRYSGYKQERNELINLTDISLRCLNCMALPKKGLLIDSRWKLFILLLKLIFLYKINEIALLIYSN